MMLQIVIINSNLNSSEI